MDKSNGKLQRQVNHNTIARWLGFGLLFTVLILSSSCGSSANSELERNEELWQSQNLTGYDFTLERQCFCPTDYQGPVNIQVRNGEVTSVTYVSNGETADAEIFADVDTIDELFKVIRDAYEGKNTFHKKAETVNVTYNPEMGYPLTILIDISSQIMDEEEGYTVEELVGR